ncbi:MAG: peptidylprolyl isomerase [Pseudomonadota bacterium]
MLDALRSMSRSWVGLALLGLLIAGLLVFGVGQTGQIGANSVVTSGQSIVTPAEYRLAYERQISALSQQFGTRLTPDQARQFGLDNQVLSQVVTGVVLDEQARIMGLGISEARQAQLIGDLYPEFYRADGRFDRDQLRFVLNQQRINEAQFLASINSATRRQQIIEALSDGMVAPGFFLQEQQRHQGQTRDVTLLEVTQDAIDEIALPSDTQLSAYFEENADRYRAPEYRSVMIVELTPAGLAEASEIDLDMVRDEYERRINNFRQEEQRTVNQLVFPDRSAAEAAVASIADGTTIEDVVSASGRSMSDVTLGTFTKTGMPDQALADAAFALSEVGEVSDIVDGVFGPILVWVTEIIPEQTTPFEEVEAQLRESLALVEANDILLSVSDAYEDARAAGATMQEAAAAQRLELLVFDAVDATGRDKNGDIVELPTSNELLREIFTADIETENPPLSASPDGFIWYEVSDIEDERARALDEVRERVISDWTSDERSRLLDEVAGALVAELDGGISPTELSETTQYTLTNKFGLMRTTDDPDIGRSGVRQVFAGGPDAAGFVPSADGDRRFVYQIAAVTDPLNAQASSDFADIVARGIGNDILQQAIIKLQEEFPVSVNQQAISLALGQ